MVVHRCDFCRKVFEKRLPCAVSLQGEDIFKFEICGDCFKDVGNNIILNCVSIDKNNGYESGD